MIYNLFSYNISIFLLIYFSLCFTFSYNYLSISDFYINFFTRFSNVDFYVFYRSEGFFLCPKIEPYFLVFFGPKSTEFLDLLSYYMTDFVDVTLGGVFLT
jgi:hypothetical protein